MTGTVRFRPAQSIADVAAVVGRLERDVRANHREVNRLFLEPALPHPMTRKDDHG